MSKNLLHTVETVSVSSGAGGCLGTIKLQSGLHEPNRIGSSCRCDTSGDSSLCVDNSRVFAVAEELGSDVLAVSVNVEFDRCCWDHASKTWA